MRNGGGGAQLIKRRKVLYMIQIFHLSNRMSKSLLIFFCIKWIHCCIKWKFSFMHHFLS